MSRITRALLVALAVSAVFFVAMFATVEDRLGWALIIGMFAGVPMSIALMAGLSLTDALARKSGWRNIVVYTLLPAVLPLVLFSLFLLANLAMQPHGLPEGQPWTHWLWMKLRLAGVFVLPLVPGGLAGGIVLYLRRDEP